MNDMPSKNENQLLFEFSDLNKECINILSELHYNKLINAFIGSHPENTSHRYHEFCKKTRLKYPIASNKRELKEIVHSLEIVYKKLKESPFGNGLLGMLLTNFEYHPNHTNYKNIPDKITNFDDFIKYAKKAGILTI